MECQKTKIANISMDKIETSVSNKNQEITLHMRMLYECG
jgi:hypothetical protein